MITPYDPKHNEQPQLTLPGFDFFSTGIRPHPDMTHDQWRAAYIMILPFVRSSHWWIGEMIRLGEYHEWLTDLSDGRLANIASVCHRVHISRRREVLSFSHHEAVASLTPDEQRTMLQLAIDNQWSVRALYAKIADGRADGILSTHGRASTRIAVLRSARASVQALDISTGKITITITDPDLLNDLEKIKDGDQVRVSLAIEAANPIPA